MQNFDDKKLKNLLEEKKFDEAKKFLEDYFKNLELTESEKGAVFVNYASIYMQVMNDINRQYSKALDEALNILKKIDAKESEVNDKIDLAKVRSEIKGGE